MGRNAGAGAPVVVSVLNENVALFSSMVEFVYWLSRALGNNAGHHLLIISFTTFGGSIVPHSPSTGLSLRPGSDRTTGGGSSNHNSGILEEDKEETNGEAKEEDS